MRGIKSFWFYSTKIQKKSQTTKHLPYQDKRVLKNANIKVPQANERTVKQFLFVNYAYSIRFLLLYNIYIYYI